MFAQSVGVFLIFYMLSIIMTLSCSDWFMVWVGLEINMMSFIALIYSRSSVGVEACMKYFFIQSMGSGILIMMFYTNFFWFDYVILTVMSYKIGGGPFYFWFPGVCESLEWGGCFVLMTMQKFLPLMLMAFLVSMFLWFIIFMSIMIGGIGSLNQKSMKRLMAYSSIHHIGWILLGNFISEVMWMIYLLIYSMMISGVILSLMKDKIFNVISMGEMGNKWSFVMGMLSMGGMPPMLGFYLKWWLFYNLLSMNWSMMFLLVVMSVLMFYVYLRVVYSVLMGSKMMSSWKLSQKSMNLINLDMVYMMGVNVGIIIWMVV